MCNFINVIKKQFLCSRPLNEYEWNNIFQDLNEDLQTSLLEATVNSELVRHHPIKVSYQIAFLKFIIKNLEELNIEISDVLYESLCRLTAHKSTDVVYKHYVVGNTGSIISLKENASFISNGTTGLQTWQAALALSEWITQNSTRFHRRNILELGSGIGLVGLVTLKLSSPKHIYLSDCHPVVLENLCENIKLNIKCHSTPSEDTSDISELSERCMLQYTVNDSRIEVLDLPWEEISSEVCEKLGTIDTVIAADIIYDNSIFKSLLDAMKNVSDHCRVEEFIFSCTVRNEDTLIDFLQLIGENNFMVTELGLPLQENFVWPSKTDIKLYSVKRMK